MAKNKKAAAGSGNGSKKISPKTMAIIICLAAIVFLVCFLTYRFLFPKVPAATESSDPNLTIEEQLANAISENESSRKETVKDYPLTVYAGDAELSALYSGVLFDGAPYGSGHYSFSGSDGDWTFSGTLKDGCLSSGKVTDYPYVFDLNDENSHSKYTGNLVGGLPKGDGTFEVISGDDRITLEGFYDSQKEFTGTVTNYPLTFGYNDFIFDGRYTGDLVSGSPEGNGQFSSENENYYIYSGVWSSGSPVGPGTLSTNCASFSSGDGANYIAKYDGGIENSQFSGQGEMTIGDEISGGYTYSGEWKDGVFSGEGKLICFDPNGQGYIYEGGFFEGAYDGKGSLIFDNENIIKYIGSFEKGQFRPSVVDLISAFCSSGSSSFEMTPQIKAYIEAHQEDLFSHNTDDLYFGSGFSYDQYAESNSNPNDKCFKTSIKLIQVNRYDESSFGFSVVELLGYSDFGKNVYYGFYFGSLPDTKPGDFVKITAYPIGFSSYKDVSGNNVPALRFVAFDIE